MELETVKLNYKVISLLRVYYFYIYIRVYLSLKRFIFQSPSITNDSILYHYAISHDIVNNQSCNN